MITKLLESIVGNATNRTLKKLRPRVAEINRIEETYQALTDDELKAKTAEFKQRVAGGETLEQILPEAFAAVKNASRRLVGTKYLVRGHEVEWQMVPYDVQLIGGMALAGGAIAEMRTGEGKTLVSSLPAYLNALAGKGVHMITVNNYLTRRDAEWMGHLFNFLGLTVGVVDHGMGTAERQEAYRADITYGTNTEFGFDYLRDNMARSMQEVVQRGHAFAIVDEVDSILIDEARTPLIISAPAEESTEKYGSYSKLIPSLIREEDYKVDEKQKTASLTEAGIAKVESKLGLANLYGEEGSLELHHIEQALKAQTLFQRDKDYVVTDEGEIVIVDEFTGRLMPGRRYSDGLHQALEAKEKVEVKRESKTLATITLQNYFRMYGRLAGMTGTAETEAEEFAKIYGLETIVIPTHRAIARVDMPDSVYKTEAGKFTAAVKKVQELHEKGQPVLVGTTTIEKSERMAQLLSREGIRHTVLNAKQHEREAEIVADAGQKGAVTIATNMAGRGTDIRLGEGVAELGGLFVLGTERHESRRIDNQLRGRSGRQGDPGASQFFVSMEDSLMRLFGGKQLQSMMDFLRVPEDMPIENGTLTRNIEGAQKKVEAHHFDIRKHLVQYDDVLNKHREIIYTRRRKVLENAEISETFEQMLKSEAERIAAAATAGSSPTDWDLGGLIESLKKFGIEDAELAAQLERFDRADEVSQATLTALQGAFQRAQGAAPAEAWQHAERQVLLSTIDRLWMEHLENMRYLREKVAFRGYGQRDPLVEYKSEAFQMFDDLIGNIQANAIESIFRVRVQPAANAQVFVSPLPANVQTNEAEIERELEETEPKADQPANPTKTNPTNQLGYLKELLKPDPKIQNLGKDGIDKIKV